MREAAIKPCEASDGRPSRAGFVLKHQVSGETSPQSVVERHHQVDRQGCRAARNPEGIGTEARIPVLI
jgi:hypothetical protein